MAGHLHLIAIAGWALTGGFAFAQGCGALPGGCAAALDGRPPVRMAQAAVPQETAPHARPATRPRRAMESAPALSPPGDTAPAMAAPAEALPAPTANPPAAAAPLIPAPVTTTTLPAPATERRPARRAMPPAQAAPAAPAATAPVGAWSLPVPAGCPTGNILIPGDNRLSGEVRGDTICRFSVPANTSRITLVGSSGPADLRVLLYADVSTDLAPDAPLALTPGPQELRIQRRPDAPRGARPFDMTIRLD